MRKEMTDRINEIQDSMLVSAKCCFSESELSDLYYLVRITGQFFDYLSEASTFQRDDYALEYAIETIFNGVDSFYKINIAYQNLVGARPSTITGFNFSVPTFKDLFTFKFLEFTAELTFEKQCRLLLDLFKLQIVFAGFLYG